MSGKKMVVLGCIAALAVAAFTTSGASMASAAPIWHAGITCESDPTNKSHWEGQVLAFCVLFKFTPIYKYKYKFVRNINTATSANSTWSESFTDSGSGVTVSCKGTGEGTIGPESIDSQTKVVVKECSTTKGTCGSPSAEALHLPWKTELYEAASEEDRDRILNSGSGTPGWKVTCTVFGIKVTDTCEGETNAKISNGEGVVEAIFDAKSPKVNCSMGGAGAGTIEGSSKTGPLGEEALFVE
jgi:hypothetical protein